MRGTVAALKAAATVMWSRIPVFGFAAMRGTVAALKAAATVMWSRIPVFGFAGLRDRQGVARI